MQVCRQIVANLLHLHDLTPHIPFGIYIAPRPVTGAWGDDDFGPGPHHLGPRSDPPAGFLGDEQGLKAAAGCWPSALYAGCAQPTAGGLSYPPALVTADLYVIVPL